MSTALIFGANGQDGYYLSRLLNEKGIASFGISRSGEGMIGDVSDFSQVEQFIRKYSPSYVFHLAANSTICHSAIFENNKTISAGTLNILEAVRQHAPKSKVFITGSGVQFKNSGQPISEKDPFEATNPYSVARIQSVYAARYYRSIGINAYVGYLFHHESPMRKPGHLSQKIACAVKRIAKGSEEKIEIGDVSVEKEWTFAGDVAEGILTLIEQDKVYEAVIGSGIPHTIQKWMECCFELIGRDWRKHLCLKKGYAPEFKRLVSDPKTINNLGWHPDVDIIKLARMMVLEN
jgi:GDPmannose 4,6-dehydratase